MAINLLAQFLFPRPWLGEISNIQGTQQPQQTQAPKTKEEKLGEALDKQGVKSLQVGDKSYKVPEGLKDFIQDIKNNPDLRDQGKLLKILTERTEPTVIIMGQEGDKNFVVKKQK